MSQIFKTPKGTELPILDMRGKPYLQVAHRLVWFREEHADWRIETAFISITDKSALAKAEIRDAQGNVMSTAHKFENQQGFPDFIEKAETGSIGRALALVGYGTQFCSDELEEGQRLADAPIARGVKPGVPGPEDGNTTPRPGMLFYSSMAGRHVSEIERQKGRGWMEEERDRIANLPSDTAQRDYHTLDEYLKPTDGTVVENPPEAFYPPCSVCGSALALSKGKTSMYCPNFKDAAKGQHTKIPV